MSLCVWVDDQLEVNLLLALRDISTCITEFFLPNPCGQLLVKFIIGHHLITRIDVSKHDLLRIFHNVFIMEDKEGVSLHVNSLVAIRKELEAIIEVDHTELSNQLVTCFSKLD